MTERLVVIGGDAAGMTAASQVKRLGGDAFDVIVLEQGPFTSYSACGIPYWVAGDVGGQQFGIGAVPLDISPEAHEPRQ